jgi:fructose-bisphosphate aldolase class II
MAGKSVSDPNAAAAGAVALAYHVRAVAKYYGIPVVLHSDHCAKKLLPWFDGMLAADREYFEKFGEPLFSSHMLDLSEEPDEENIAICVKYFKEMASMKIWLEMEIGITGGEEDGVNNEDVDPDKLYTTPEQVYDVYQALSKVGPMFSVAAAFGNVHGVYKPGNVTLSPEKLLSHQMYTKEKTGSDLERPIFLVMHGGSGSTDDEIKAAVANGVIKMNIDTDTQWSYWDGLRGFVAEKHDYLQAQIGNPDGDDVPNKKYYDPRVWIRKAEESMIARVGLSMEKLGSVNQYTKSTEPGYSQVLPAVAKKGAIASAISGVKNLIN